MAFLQLVCAALKLNSLRGEVVEEKVDAINGTKKQKPKWRLRHITVDVRVGIRRFFRRALSCFFFEKFCYNLRHEGSCENYTLKSLFGFISGYLLTYIFFMFCVFQLDFKLTTATIMCSVLGCILTIGLAFSSKVRCIVLLTLPQFFSQRGRQALLAYAFILAVSGPAKNTLNNMGILSESLACGQEQLKAAVRQIIDAIKKPFIALKDAIKKLVKTVKEIVKKIKEILLTIKRIIMAIVNKCLTNILIRQVPKIQLKRQIIRQVIIFLVRVIKAAFEFLAKIINICNKELGTPFERCSRVFENAIADCNAKLGPLFNWLCSLAYIVKAVCYLVKFLDLICILVDFISNSIIGVVIRKIKTFIRHIRTMFYVRIKFSHTFEFQTNTSRSMAEVANDIVDEIRDRTRLLQALFTFMTSAATMFFIFMIFKVTYYRFKFLTSEKYDNRFITKDFRNLDTRRAKLGKETVLPLNNREMDAYVSVDSRRLAKTEKKALSKAITTLASASLKLIIFIVVDYCLFWILNLIKYYGRFQSKVQAPNIPTAHISGNGLLADLLKGIVRAFQPLGIQLEIDTVPCLPTPIPPNYDRYIQIITLLLLCWILTVLEPYGLRLRQMIMCYYHPTRAKERAIWLYNHIMRSRNSFLKFARRQLRRRVMGEKGIEKITCKEYFSANFKFARLCFGEGLQTACLLCGQVFRESDDKKPIKCQTPGCPGIYCEQCFSDLQNLCTICLSPIEYGDMSDISEEKDSSDDGSKRGGERKKKRETDDSSGSEKDKPRKLKDQSSDKKDKTGSDKSKKRRKDKDSDYYSSEDTTDYSYSYQYDDSHEPQPMLPLTSSKDVEKQEIPHYASMESFREKLPEETIGGLIERQKEPPKRDASTTCPLTDDVGTAISGTTFGEIKKKRHIDFIGISSDSSEISMAKVAKVRVKKKPSRKQRDEEKIPLIRPADCLCSDTSDSDLIYHERPLTALPRSTTATTSTGLRPCYSTSSDDNEDPPRYVELDREVKDDLRYIHMLIPQLDLSELTESEPCPSNHSYAEDKFSNVTYEEVSETPRSPISSRNLTSSTYISSLKEEDFVKVPSNEQEIENIEVNEEVKVSGPSEEIPKLPPQASTSSFDSHNLENSQKEKVKQYYKAVRDIPTQTVEEKPKPCAFVRFVQRLLPKCRKKPDELPLYSKNKEVIELKSYNYNEDKWDTLSTTAISSSTYIRQESAESPENPTSTEEEEEEKRVRGGQSGLLRNRSTKRYQTGYIQLKKLAQPEESKLSITRDLLSKYFVSIEDLTPTRDCGPMSTAKTLRPVATYGTGGALVREVPEKDEPRTSGVSLTNTAGTSTSSNLSDGLYLSILGKSAKPPKKKKAHIETDQGSLKSLRLDTLFSNKEPPIDSKSPKKKLSDIASESKLVAEKEVTQLKNTKVEPAKRNKDTLEKTNLVEVTKGKNDTTVESNLVEVTKAKNDTTVGTNLVEVTTTEVAENTDPKKPPSITRASVAIETNINSSPTTHEISTSTKEPLNKDPNSCKCENSFQKDQKLQTFPVPILKVKCPSDRSVVIIKEATTCSQTCQSGIGRATAKSDTMVDAPDRHHVSHKKVETQYPVKEHVYCHNRERILLTSDKMQQTSDDDNCHSQSIPNVRCSGVSNRATVCSSAYATDSGKTRTCNISSNKASTYIQTTETMQPTPSSSNLCECLCSDTTDSNRICGCYMRTPPPPPQYASIKEKCYRTVSPPEICPAYKERHHKCSREVPSEHIVCSKSRRKVYCEVPTEDTFSFCESQCKRSGHSSRHSRRSRPVECDQPRRRKSKVKTTCKCTGDCDCCPRICKPRQSSSPPHRYCSLEYGTSSSDMSDPTDDNDYYSDCPPNRFDLPYQNNDDYLELVQELEETLQSRNRNRVRRAMQEFEHRSKFNKPLEQPIINYDETSESEEPIIEKISKLTAERKGCCGGEVYQCRRKSSRHAGKSCPGKRQPRPRSGGYTCATICRQLPGDPSLKTHWQLDKISGEWYKVSEHPQRRRSGRRSKTPSPQRGFCPYNCSCCGPRRYDYR